MRSDACNLLSLDRQKDGKNARWTEFFAPSSIGWLLELSRWGRQPSVARNEALLLTFFYFFLSPLSTFISITAGCCYSWCAANGIRLNVRLVVLPRQPMAAVGLVLSFHFGLTF